MFSYSQAPHSLAMVGLILCPKTVYLATCKKCYWQYVASLPLNLKFASVTRRPARQGWIQTSATSFQKLVRIVKKFKP